MTKLNRDDSELLVAYPIGNDRIRLVFSGPIDPETAAQPRSYVSSIGLTIVGAEVAQGGTVDADGPASRVTLSTEPMNGYSLVVDTIKADDVRSRSGKPLSSSESPQFIQGIASIPGVQWPISDEFPFTHRPGAEPSSPRRDSTNTMSEWWTGEPTFRRQRERIAAAVDSRLKTAVKGAWFGAASQPVAGLGAAQRPVQILD